MEHPARLFVVVTGLPGAGKTTVAKALADELSFALLSKDTIKEALFDAVGWGGWERSKALSRAADATLVEIARESPRAVLDNFWRPSSATSLLEPLAGSLVEVWCRCAPETAMARFYNRDRHPGHADAEADDAERRASFLRHTFPIGTLGPVVEVDTETPLAAAELATRVRAAAATLAR